MPGECCSFLMFYCILHFCLYTSIILTDGATSMQMICSIFKVFVFLPVVLWAGLWILLNDIYFGIVFCLFDYSNNPVPQKLCLCFRVLDTVEDESVVVFEARVELNS